MSRRIFLGLHFSEKLQRKMFEWMRQFKKLPVRFIKPHNLHITLLPPWEEKNVSAVIEKLKTLENSIGEIETNFTMVTFGPSMHSPRVIWATGISSKNIVSLQKNLEKIFPEKLEKRIFLPHVTLARFHPEDFQKFPVKNLHEKVYWKETFFELTLFESHLLPSGAEYEVLAKISL